jgi:hypothetical protein
VNGAPSSLVSPGLWGFVAFFVLALALYLLMRNMNARMRRMSYRSQELAKEAERAEQERRARKERPSAPTTSDDPRETRDGGDAQEHTGEKD